ncbi:hypothetical protein EV363DRAFT_1312365 [Boletus edulis]|nr:hypothetical protein EV363DRAFT_1312365 [Boletus edulis]
MSAKISPNSPLHPLLAQYLVQLSTNPLRTKALTSATFSFLQEVIGSHAADASVLTKALARAHINAKAFKMALYGFSVSAPLGHVLVGLLQRAFTGKVGLKYRLAQLLASNLLIAPIQTTAFLASYGYHQWCQVNWVVSPLSMVVAQQFIPVEVGELYLQVPTKLTQL